MRLLLVYSSCQLVFAVGIVIYRRHIWSICVSTCSKTCVSHSYTRFVCRHSALGLPSIVDKYTENESLEESMHRKMSSRLALAEKWKAKREMYMSLYIMYRSQIYCFIVDVNLPLLMFEFNYNNDLTGILIYLLGRKILEIALRKRVKYLHLINSDIFS